MQEDSSKGGLGDRKRTRVDLTPWRNHRSYKHRVRWIEGGKRREKGFKVKDDAKAFQKEKENELALHGTGGAPTAEERAAIIENRAKLSEAGLSLREAIGLALKVHERNSKSVTIGQAVEEFIALKEGNELSKRHLSGLAIRLRRFEADMREARLEEGMGEMLMSEVGVKDLDTWLNGMKSKRTGKKVSPKTRKNYRNHVTMLFKQCIAWGYCDTNPVKQTQKPANEDKEVTVLTPSQASNLLAKATPEILPAIAIGLFAGCRVSELQRLDWQEVNLDTDLIELQGAVTKKKFRRIIPIEPNLKAWLLQYRQKEGPVAPRGYKWRKAFNETRKAAGFAVMCKGDKGKPEGVAWGSNSMRHSFASYRLQQTQSPGQVAIEMGHRGSPQILFDHYVTTRKPELAEAFWNIVPDGADNVIGIGEGAA